MELIRRSLSLFLSSYLVLSTAPFGFADQTNQNPPQTPEQTEHLTSKQLDQLVAPIALYPDSLVAQILAASTYPDQVVEADRWMQAHSDLKGKKLGKEVNKQKWDSSVKALTEFPSVLANMDKNLSWTSSLGDAYVNQQQDVMKAVQHMRTRAQKSGNLKSTPQENVSEQGQNIVIEPASPDVVYVPQYDPWLIYGAPIVAWPGWFGYPGLYLGGPGFAFGVGFGVGLFGGFGWGWGHWDGIGTTASSLITVAGSRTAEFSIIAHTSMLAEADSIMVFMATDFTAEDFMVTISMVRLLRIQELSVDLIMAA